MEIVSMLPGRIVVCLDFRGPAMGGSFIVVSEIWLLSAEVSIWAQSQFQASAKFVQAKRGLEFLDPDSDTFYGGSIYGSEDFREGDLNHELGQGNTANFRHLEFDAGYVINPSSQLKLFTRIILRSLSPEVSEEPNQKLNTTWWSLGLRTDLFNWYRDF